MAVSQTKPNLAKESGGNLDTVATQIKLLERLVSLQAQALVELKTLNLQIMSLTGNPVVSEDVYLSN